MKKYDLIIVGGGPAGLTAAVYGRRKNLSVLVIAKSLGGQAALTREVENWPGSEMIGGFELMDKFKKQAEYFGTEFISNEVIKIEKNDGAFTISTSQETFEAAAIILAFGLTPRDLNVPGEERLKGAGVTYCATCDGPLYKNKIVGVVGGGNSAIEAAEYLSKITKQVYLFHKTDDFRADPIILDKVKSSENVKLKCFTEIKEIIGEKKVEAVKIVDTKDNKEETITIDGLFIEIGHAPKTAWLKDTVNLNDKGEIITSRDCETSQPGIFAAGDCTDTTYKQIVIASGEGAKAGLQAYKYLANKENKILPPDWGKHESSNEATVKLEN